MTPHHLWTFQGQTLKAHIDARNKNDRHFRHQLVIRFLRMVRAPRVEMWGGGSAIYRYDRIMVAVRELFGQRLEAHLGLLCLRMARILQEHTRALHQPPRQITNH